MENPINQKRHKLLWGLTVVERDVLIQELNRRILIPREERSQYPMPLGLKGSWLGCWWWALVCEWQDRPFLTLLGVLAVLSYPIVWVCLRHYH